MPSVKLRMIQLRKESKQAKKVWLKLRFFKHMSIQYCSLLSIPICWPSGREFQTEKSKASLAECFLSGNPTSLKPLCQDIPASVLNCWATSPAQIIYLFTQDFKLLLFFQLAGRHLEYSEQVGLISLGLSTWSVKSFYELIGLFKKCDSFNQHWLNYWKGKGKF